MGVIFKSRKPPELPRPSVAQTGRRIGWRAEWILQESFRLTVPLGRGEFTWEIPAGMTTDFASIPRGLVWLISPTDPEILVAALIHDDLYRNDSGRSRATAGRDTDTTSKSTTRFMADSWFRDIMRLYGAPIWKRLAAYYAVRVFGHWAYQS